MLTEAPTPEMMEDWKELYRQYSPLLTPNRKPAWELIDYLKEHYPLTEIWDEEWVSVVEDNVLYNEPYRDKIPEGKLMAARVFSVRNEGAGAELYRRQDEVFAGVGIAAGFELASGFFLVEGSSLLWDELTAFQGLDEADLQNFYLVAEYVSCLKRIGKLEEVLSQNQKGGI